MTQNLKMVKTALLINNMNQQKGKPRAKRRKPSKKRFEETRVGYLMRYHAPIEFALLVDSCGKKAPSADIIEEIGYVSNNDFFRTICFRRALMDYRKNGLRCQVAFGCRKKR